MTITSGQTNVYKMVFTSEELEILRTQCEYFIETIKPGTEGEQHFFQSHIEECEKEDGEERTAEEIKSLMLSRLFAESLLLNIRTTLDLC